MQIRLGDGDCLGLEAAPFRGGFFGFTGSEPSNRSDRPSCSRQLQVQSALPNPVKKVRTWCWCSFWSQRVLTDLRYFRCTIKLSAAKSVLFARVTIFFLWFLDTAMSPSRPILVNSIESVWCLIGRLVIDRLINAGMLVYNLDESNSFGWILTRVISL